MRHDKGCRRVQRFADRGPHALPAGRAHTGGGLAVHVSDVPRATRASGIPRASQGADPLCEQALALDERDRPFDRSQDLVRRERFRQEGDPLLKRLACSQ